MEFAAFGRPNPNATVLVRVTNYLKPLQSACSLTIVSLRDFFSKRAARAAKAGAPDVYQYDDLPDAFRVQVVHIWQRALGDYCPQSVSRLYGPPPSIWEAIETDIAEEHGVFRLGNERDPFERVANYFLRAKESGKALDVIEAVFTAIEHYVRPDLHYASIYVKQHPDDAIADLNRRFREHGIGYQYANEQVMRIDSQYMHAEAVKPALVLLSAPGFAGPLDEFMRAHKHYRDGKHKEAINEALKAFESTMKSICDQRGWAYDKNKDAAKALIEVVLREGLVPTYLQTAFGGLRAVLEGAVPTARNRTSGHGQGAAPTVVPEYFAAYVLHMTASNIVFLIEANSAKS